MKIDKEFLKNDKTLVFDYDLNEDVDIVISKGGEFFWGTRMSAKDLYYYLISNFQIYLYFIK